MKAQVTGHKEIERVLKMLPRKLGQAAMYSAVTSAGYIIAKEVKKSVPDGGYKYEDRTYNFKKRKYGHIFENITRFKIPERGLRASQMIGIKTRAYWARWIESGLPARPAVARKPGKRRLAKIGKKYRMISTTGALPKRPFFHPAVDRAFPKARKKLMDVIVSRIKKQVNILCGPYRNYRKRI